MIYILCAIHLWILLINESLGMPQNKNTTNVFNDKQKILFPDALRQLNSASGKDIFAKCSGDFPLCENVDAYPYDYVKTALKQNQIYKYLFFDDVLSEVPNRLDETDDVVMCKHNTTIKYPRMGLNKNNKWKFIVNQRDNGEHGQGVKVEICRDADKECDFPGYTAEGYKTFCRQRYAYRVLVSIDNDEGNLSLDWFPIPSGCCCSYQQYLNPVPLVRNQVVSAIKSKNNK